jgi:hypothetical protein
MIIWFLEKEHSVMAELPHPDVGGWTRKAPAPIAALTNWILITIEDWRERFRLRRELEDLRLHGEFDRTLADSLISPSDIPRLMRVHPGTSRQLADMMLCQGIDRAALACMPRMRDIEWRCGECKDWRKCRSWLASRDAPDNYRAFCPNAEAFDELRRAEHAGSNSSFRKLSGALPNLRPRRALMREADGG